MATFVVVKQGVYIQGVYGPFIVISAAINAAGAFAFNDRDSYHEYDVHELKPDGLDDKVLYSIKKQPHVSNKGRVVKR